MAQEGDHRAFDRSVAVPCRRVQLGSATTSFRINDPSAYRTETSPLPCSVLDPASALAKNAVRDGLRHRSQPFVLDKIDCYEAKPAVWEIELQGKAGEVDIVTFGSLRAVQKVG